MAIDLNSLTPAQLTAVRSNNPDKMREAGLSSSQINELLSQALNPNSGNLSNGMGLSIERTLPQVTTSVVETPTTRSTITTVQSSEAFYASQDQVKQAAEDLANKCANNDIGNYQAEQAATDIVKSAIPPDVNDVLAVTKQYDNTQYPSSNQNVDANAQGVMKYLENSQDPEIADLARRANMSNTGRPTPDEVNARRQLNIIVDSWQPDMIENAQNGKVTKYGDPIKDSDKPWIVPSKYVTVEDKDKINPPPPPPSFVQTDEPQGNPPIAKPTRDFSSLGEGDGKWTVEGNFYANKLDRAVITNFSDDNPFIHTKDHHHGYVSGGGFNLAEYISANPEFPMNDANGDGLVTFAEIEAKIKEKEPDYKLPDKYEQYRNTGINIAKLRKAVNDNQTVDFTKLLEDAE